MKNCMAAAMLFPVIVSGCAVDQPYWKYKDGTVDQQAFSATTMECKMVAIRLGSSNPDGTDQNWITCMQSKGWVISETKKAYRPLF